ncbi:hypothetical protein TRFO_11250 [Tritrichomonas foetus]|uniref:Uncharacterized protein n=1 Tax=Tritrichomonas foetus TaxID=1144522 RepID=A0A1J4J7K2_9EUKA|nr:hypothetical protein TRFO_11250 [Tritrichomonas foetus]|eukprot:OHS94191.1 hypothetical protein TRFO_11250 [Tritrichomonas foetus]
MIILGITIYVRTPSIHSPESGAQQKIEVMDDEHDSVNHWYDIIIPSQNQIGKTSFLYPEILYPKNISVRSYSFDRKKFQIELSRFIGLLNPRSPTFSQPKVLVIGSNTAVGSAVVKELKSRKIPVLPMKNYIYFDFSYKDANIFFENVSLSSIIVVHQPPIFKYATTDGFAYISQTIQNYTDGFMKSLKKNNLDKIPIVYAVPPPYFEANTNVDYCYGSKLVFLPNVIDSNELYDTDNILLRAARECQIHGKTTVLEYSGEEMIESVTAESAAQFLISQIESFSPGRVTLRGSSNISLHDAIKLITQNPTQTNNNNNLTIIQDNENYEKEENDQNNDGKDKMNKNYENGENDKSEKKCRVTFVKSVHSIPPVKLSKNEFVIDGDVSSMIETTFDSFKEPKNKNPYLTIVITGRNDHFAGGFEDRAQVFLNKLGEAIEKVPTADIELIFVDYATDYPKNTYLDKVFTYPKELKNKIRFIIVPPSHHEMLTKKLKTRTPFLEYIAKNIGIYRSRGEFILTMNPDSILSVQFLECVANRNLNEGFLYQASRFSLTEEITRSNTKEDIFQLIEEPWNHKKIMFTENVDTSRNDMKLYRDYFDFELFLFRAGAGDFLLMSKKLWEAIGGFHEFGVNTQVDNMLNMKLLRMVTGFVRVYLPFSIVHQEHEHVSPKFGEVNDMLKIFEQFIHHGQTNAFDPERDALDWGYKDCAFEEILI